MRREEGASRGMKGTMVLMISSVNPAISCNLRARLYSEMEKAEGGSYLIYTQTKFGKIMNWGEMKFGEGNENEKRLG